MLNDDELVKAASPVKTSVQCFHNYLTSLDSGFHRNDNQ
jgi:hypothetical protein